MQYKPKEIMHSVDAIYFGSIMEDADKIVKFLGYTPEFDSERSLKLKTKKGGTVYVKQGQWILKNAAGQVFPCDPVNFEKSYEQIPC